MMTETVGVMKFVGIGLDQPAVRIGFSIAHAISFHPSAFVGIAAIAFLA